MSDTTRAAKLLSEMKGAQSEAGRSAQSEKSLPPPPSSGTLPFSIPFSQPKPQSNLNSNAATAASPNATAPTKNGNLKQKWIVVKEKCSNVLKTQGIAALVVFLIVAGIMAAMNPPIVQTKGKNPEDKPKRSVVKILIWAVLAAALVMVIPLGVEYAKKKKAKAGVSSSGGSTA